MRRFLLALACLLPAACAGGGGGGIDSAELPPGALGSAQGDPDVAALALAQTAFENVNRIYGRPEAAARAILGLDYIAGEMSASSRWENVSPATKQALLQARGEVRQQLGVAPGTPSQVVVDRLSAAATALAAGNEAAAAAQLGPPAFDAPGAVVLGRLANVPSSPAANVATSEATNEILDVSGQ